MLLVHLHYPNADLHIGQRFAECKHLFAVSELFALHGIRAHLPRPIGTRRTQSIARPGTLEGLAASEAGPGLRRRAVAVNVAPEPVCLTERGHG